MIVRIPTHLHSYTGGESRIEIDVTTLSKPTLARVLDRLDERFPGIRFRFIDEQDEVRQHIKLFLASEQVFDLKTGVRQEDEVQIVAAMSGGC